MAAAFLLSTKPATGPFHHHKPSSPQRLTANSPIPSSSASSRSTNTPELIPPQPETSSKAFQRLRSSLGQSLRTATRSKKSLPSAPSVDDFATFKVTSKGKQKEKVTTEDPPPLNGKGKEKEKEKINMLRRVTFRRTPSPVLPTAPASSSSKDARTHSKTSSSPQNPPPNGRLAGFTSFITPSMRQGSMSSPALHLSSQPIPSPRSRPSIPAVSSSTADALVSPSPSPPSKQRARRTTLQPASASGAATPAREISGPTLLSASGSASKHDANDGQTARVNRHRSTKSYTPAIPSSPSTPTVHLYHTPRETTTKSRRDGVERDGGGEKERRREREREREREKEERERDDSPSASSSPPDTPTPIPRTNQLARNASRSSPMGVHHSTGSAINMATNTPSTPIRARSPSTRVASPTTKPSLPSHSSSGAGLKRTLTSASTSHLPLTPSALSSSPPSTPTAHRRPSVDVSGPRRPIDSPLPSTPISTARRPS
ncbi:hypothetical protein BDZ97DRAFT_703186 [Flammula alnicola]|nr:hypothetical protein BDZ97DRAFT_703186 [Flammula alnicola]